MRGASSLYHAVCAAGLVRAPRVWLLTRAHDSTVKAAASCTRPAKSSTRAAQTLKNVTVACDSVYCTLLILPFTMMMISCALMRGKGQQ